MGLLESENQVAKIEENSVNDGIIEMTSLTIPVSMVDELIKIKIIPQEPHYMVIRRLLDSSPLVKPSKKK